MNHFVVLVSAHKKRFVLHDPAIGRVEADLKEVSSKFTGVALELSPAKSFKRAKIKVSKSISLRSMIGGVDGGGYAAWQILILSICLEIIIMAGPFYMQWIMDSVLPSLDVSLLSMLGIAFLLLGIFRVIIYAARSWAITWVGGLINVQWSANMFNHLIKLAFNYFERRHVGDIQSRFGSIKTIQNTITTQFVSVVIDSIMSILIVALMLSYSIKLTALVVISIIVYIVFRYIILGLLKRESEAFVISSAKEQSYLLESIRGVQPLKLANQQSSRSSRFYNYLVATNNSDLKLKRLKILSESFNELIFGILRVSLIWISALYVIDGNFTAGMMVAFIAYSDIFISRASRLADSWNDFKLLDVHIHRVADIALGKKEEGLDGQGGRVVENYCIGLKDIKFRYGSSDPWVLNNFNLEVSQGECVAITGPSGCGKSTLAKIILGLLRPESGVVECGGVDIYSLGLFEYRKFVSAVLQDDQLFAGTIASNISYGDESASRELIENSAKLAQIHDEILAMPMGYETMVGDMGSVLSGGQRLRVLLARALYRQPRILILDEATSHLDMKKEKLVNQTISSLNITRIIIAHRQETISSADRVVVLGGD